MCAVYRVFNLSGKRSCGPGQCRPATAGSAQGLINIYKAVYLRTVLPETKVSFGSYQELLQSNSGTQTMRLADVTRPFSLLKQFVSKETALPRRWQSKTREFGCTK